MNNAGFFIGMSTTCAYLAVMRGSHDWERLSRVKCRRRKSPSRALPAPLPLQPIDRACERKPVPTLKSSLADAVVRKTPSSGQAPRQWPRLSRVANVYGKLFAQGAESCLHLVEPGGVPEIKQAIHLGHVTIQPAGEFRFAHLGGSHCGKRASLASVSAGSVANGPLAPARGMGMSRRSAI